ncbi:MAG: ATP-binding cassette domain-containing protein [bacterium]|nr:ATP-binding cassette domain-containing protein [bacterium]
MLLAFNRVTFTYEGTTSALLEDITAQFPLGWTGIVGPNGAGKTTVLHLAAGELQPQHGIIKRPEHIVLCPQRTDDIPAELPYFIDAMDVDACVIRGKLQIRDDWTNRWHTLSHGERKRAQIAVALWQQPDALLIDEPTNHIDITTRELLLEALSTFSGIGLLVSHDRDLLDILCRQCFFLDPPEAMMRPGNYTEAASEAEREEKTLTSKRRVVQQELEHIARESQRRHSEAAKADGKRSKRNLARGDSDGRAKIDAARVSGKDGKAGRLAKQMDGRLNKAKDLLSTVQSKKRYKLNFWLDSSVSPRERLFSIPAGSLSLDGERRLSFPALTMPRQDRIAVTGANGTGKSTLLRYIADQLTISAEHLIYLPQEIDLAQTREIMTAVHQLSHQQLGTVMTVVSSLGSRPGRLLENLDASPGELRKILLALGVIRHPYLIIMDEPTNHLDLSAIECLESALAACPCGLLLVSHDQRFLSNIAHTRWHLEQTGKDVRLRISSM